MRRVEPRVLGVDGDEHLDDVVFRQLVEDDRRHVEDVVAETLEEQLCAGLEDTFPASDPVSVVSTLIAGRCKKLVGTEEVLRQMRDAERRMRRA